MAKRLRRRARRSAEEWSRLVAEWHGSGMTAEAFSAERDLSRTSLFKWASRLKSEEKRAARGRSFVAVRVVADETLETTGSTVPGHDGGHIELVALSGRVIRLSGAVDKEALTRVLEVAERC